MPKQQWVLLDKWVVDDGQRMIFKPKKSSHLVDVILTNEQADQIIAEVTGNLWTHQELLDFLNRNVQKKS